MRKKIVLLLLSVSMLGFGAGCSDKEATDKENTENVVQEAEEESVVNSEGLVVAVDTENLENYMTLGEYRNLTVEESPVEETTDEDVDEYIERQMTDNYSPVEVTEDRPVQENDTVNIDYAGYQDGEAFDGGTAQDQDLRIGSGRYIEGFEEGLIGHKKGETVTLNLTFPEDYDPNPDLAGQPVVFEVTINSISQPPALTDDWAAENTDYDTAQEYWDAQKEALIQERTNEYESQVKSDLFQQVMESSQIKDYPEDALEELKTDIETQMDQMYTTMYGMSLEEALEAQGVSAEEAEQSIDESAKSYLSQYMVTQAILDAEGVSLTEEDYENALDDFAKLSGFENGEAIKSMYSDAGVLKGNVLWNVACDKIMETAVITEPAAEETAEDTAQ